MTRTEAPPRAAALRVLLTAVAVVLGILAMHAVSGGPHRASASAPAAGTHLMADGAGTAGGPAADLIPAEQLAAAASSRVRLLIDAAAAAGGPAEKPMAMLAMCLAVLLAVVVLARRLAQWPTVTPRTTRSAPAPRGRRPAWRPPPDDLLLRLCVMRT